MKLLFFQHGNYGEAYRRFAEGGAETYRDQKHSVDFVASLRGRFQVTTVAVCDEPHEIELAPSLWSIGLSRVQAFNRRQLETLLDRLRPDLIVCRTPNMNVIGWARRNKRPSLLAFADFFPSQGLRSRASNLLLRRQMEAEAFPCIANHSLNASLSVAHALGYPKSRIVPWDWSPLRENSEPKCAPQAGVPPTGIFVGSLSSSKGLGDCLSAVARLRRKGIPVRLVCAGPGDVDTWTAAARSFGIQEQVEFIGIVPNDEVRHRMRRADFVVVPSRHDYAEGLPNTIYEALASRTPLITSDHPSFASRLSDGENCLVFKAGDANSLADKISALLKDSQLYASLSHASGRALANLYVGLDWCKLVSKFLDDPANRSHWVEENSLAALGY